MRFELANRILVGEELVVDFGDLDVAGLVR